MTQALPKLLVIDDQQRYIELAHEFLTDYRFATRCELAGPCQSCTRPLELMSVTRLRLFPSVSLPFTKLR